MPNDEPVEMTTEQTMAQKARWFAALCRSSTIEIQDVVMLASAFDALADEIERQEAAVRALQAERDRLRELVKRGGSAITAAYEEAQAEYAGHDIRAGRLDDEVMQWRKDARAALAASREDGK